MKWVKHLVLAAAVTVSSIAQAQQPAKVTLYEGEQAINAAGFPAVAYFKKGDPSKPMIIFIPGSHHMARIAYGGHTGSHPQDFLGYWLADKGYSFLALSYPIDTATPAFATVHPEYSAQDWGRQVAEIAKRKIAEHGLSNTIVFAAWSMGGKAVQPSFKAAKDAGLNVATTISFAATPGMPALTAYTARINMAPSGYADRKTIYDGWLKQLAADNAENGGRIIVPEAIYKAEYIGDIPIGLQGYGEVYRHGRFEIDHHAQATDYGAYDFADYPLVTVFENNNVADARHGLADRANWTLYNTNMVLKRYIAGNKVKLDALPHDKWQKLLTLTHSLGERLTISIPGNHFFFVGEAGARRTAQAIDEALERTTTIKAEFADILGVKVD